MSPRRRIGFIGLFGLLLGAACSGGTASGSGTASTGASGASSAAPSSSGGGASTSATGSGAASSGTTGRAGTSGGSSTGDRGTSSGAGASSSGAGAGTSGAAASTGGGSSTGNAGAGGSSGGADAGSSGGDGGVTVQLSTLCAAGAGGDDTACLQTAIDQTAAAGQVLEIPPASSGSYNAQPLTLPTNANLLLDPGATVTATTTGYESTTACLLTVIGDGVTLTGTPGQSVFQMNKSLYTDGSEWRHCLDAEGVANLTLDGISCNLSGGDGLYVASAATNVTVTSCTFDQDARNAISIISVNGMTVSGTTLSHTAGNGTCTNNTDVSGVAPCGPWDGIDLEPNGPTDELSNVLIENTTSVGNAGDGIRAAIYNLTSASAPVGVTVSSCTDQGSAGTSFKVTGSNAGTTGAILFDGCSSTSAGGFGAWAEFWSDTGPTVTFQNLDVLNANQAQANYDQAAVGVECGGGMVGPLGNAYFTGATIQDTNPTPLIEYYFTFENYSATGVQNVQFLNPTLLSGASGITDGLLDGAGVDSVNQ